MNNDDINNNKPYLFNLLNFECRNYVKDFKQITLNDLNKIINSLDACKGTLASINKRLLPDLLKSKGHKLVDTLNFLLTFGVFPDN